MSKVSKFFKRVVRKKKINKALKVVDNVSDLAIRVGEGNQISGYLELGIGSLLEALKKETKHVLIEGFYVCYMQGDFTKFLIRFILERYPSKKLTINNYIYNTVEIGPCTLVLSRSMLQAFCNDLSCSKKAKEKLVNLINISLQKVYGRYWYLSTEVNTFRKPYKVAFRLKKWNPEPYQSVQVIEIHDRLYKYVSNKISTSILLYGESEKEVTKTVEGILSKTTSQIIVINPEERFITPRVIKDIIRFCEFPIIYITGIETPNCVSMDYLCYRLKRLDIPHIIIGTAPEGLLKTHNYPHFNDHIEITSDKVDVSEFPSHIQNQLEMWPSDFVEELKKRVDILGEDCIDVEFEVLNSRIADRDCLNE